MLLVPADTLATPVPFYGKGLGGPSSPQAFDSLLYAFDQYTRAVTIWLTNWHTCETLGCGIYEAYLRLFGVDWVVWGFSFWFLFFLFLKNIKNHQN